MSDKHTPGPWTVIKSRDVFSAVIAPGVRTICYDIENDSDAELIAAAPQLLAALREARKAMTNYWYMQPRIGMERECELADAAIAAATGEGV